MIISAVALNAIVLLSANHWRQTRADAGLSAQPPTEQPKTLSVSPQIVLGPHTIFRGQSESPYTLVEFGDYQCPPCAQIYPQTHEIVTRFDGRLKFVFRHYPLQMHTNAMPAALAAENARSTGKFWQMHDALYKLQGKVDVTSIRAVAQKLKVDTNTGNDATAQARIERDRADGDKAGVEGTPTFILCCPDGKVIKLAELSQVGQFIK